MLSRKRFLITGANGGIGSSISNLFLQNNADLVLLYYQNRNNIDKLVEKNKNSKIELHEVNLLDDEKINTTMKKILASGAIYGFIHCVSLPLEIKSSANASWDEFQINIEIQTKSFFQIVKYIIPIMKNLKKGKILTILSSAIVGRPPSNMAPYVVSKYSLLGLSKSLAIELAPFGINVNSISPFMVDTPLIEKFPNKLKEITQSQVPLNRLAISNDVAFAALFLCSEHSDYICGENLILSGGHTLH